MGILHLLNCKSFNELVLRSEDKVRGYCPAWSKETYSPIFREFPFRKRIQIAQLKTISEIRQKYYSSVTRKESDNSKILHFTGGNRIFFQCNIKPQLVNYHAIAKLYQGGEERIDSYLYPPQNLFSLCDRHENFWIIDTCDTFSVVRCT